MNKTTYRDASILIAGKNFGCGSSREHAVWALMEAASGSLLLSRLQPSFTTTRSEMVSWRLHSIGAVDALVAPVRVEALSVNLADQTSQPALWWSDSISIQMPKKCC